MPIQQDYSPNLDTDAIYAFLMGADGLYDGPLPTRPGYDSVPGITPKFIPDQVKTSLFWAKREWWDMYEVQRSTKHRIKSGELQFVVVVEQPVLITFGSVLLLQAGLADGDLREKIIKAFESYQVEAGVDPVEYARQQLGAEYDPKTFAVMSVFRLEKFSRSVSHDEHVAQQIDFARRSYRVPDRDIDFTKRDTVDHLGRVPPAPPPHPQQVQQGNRTPEEIADTVAKDNQPDECSKEEKYKTYSYEIGSLREWSEFRVVWRDTEWNLGCGVRIIVRLPYFETQKSSIRLMAYVRGPNEYWFSSAANDCVRGSAYAATVVGFALWSLQAAINSFVGAFELCIRTKIGTMVKCMTAGLVLVQKVDVPWPT